jgi:hypothetical protein
MQKAMRKSDFESSFPHPLWQIFISLSRILWLFSCLFLHFVPFLFFEGIHSLWFMNWRKNLIFSIYLPYMNSMAHIPSLEKHNFQQWIMPIDFFYLALCYSILNILTRSHDFHIEYRNLEEHQSRSYTKISW